MNEVPSSGDPHLARTLSAGYQADGHLETSDTPAAEATRRIPHIGHAALFLLLIGVLLLLFQATLAIFLIFQGHARHASPSVSEVLHAPKVQIAGMAATYLVALGLASLLFPWLWSKPFAAGLHWNSEAARRYARRLIPLGVGLSLVVAFLSHLIDMPKSMPLNDFFHTRSDIWVVTAFGTLLAPLTEEICFRGFLLPAFAIAFDWLRLPKNQLAADRWAVTDSLSRPALILSSLLTSFLFALLHAQQLAHAWKALFLLGCVSLILCAVRIVTRSVAASTLVHASYNFTIFLTLFLGTGGYRHLERMTQ